MEYVFSIADAIVIHDGVHLRLRPGQPWAANDPFVVAHPDWFRSDPPGVFTSSGELAPVEQATAAPGERRSVRRGR